MNPKSVHPFTLLIVVIGLFAAPALFAATTHCVNQNGSHGCFSSISAAVAASAPGDIIQVSRGTYNDDVVINKPLSLVGESRYNTVIDAANLADAVEIDGHNNPGLSHVLVTGFTVENAQFAGILVTNASAVSITNNHVINNDTSLSGGQCPGLPSYFASGEAIDCGEGIHLSGVDYSTISNNIVERNAGGILVADDVGPNHDNVITNNLVQNNKPDCGITLASHNPNGAGVFRNTIAWNQSYGNGGAGVGIFAPGPGSQAYANKVLYNNLSGNVQPGVTMHNHAAPGVGGVPGFLPPVVFSDNVIVGNRIWKNSADLADAATSGPTGINLFSLVPMPGTIIEQNDIFDESLDVAFNVPAAPPGTADIQVHSNDLLKPVGVQNTGTAVIDATENWWGCSRGPNSPGCSSVVGNGVIFAPWLTRPNGSFDQRHED